MVRFNKQRQKMLDLSLYQLKRHLGVGPLDIYKFGGSTVDLETGSRELQRTKYSVALVIPLNSQSSRRVEQTISKIGAAREFVYGGYFDRETRVFIVHQEDIPDLELSQDDWFTYKDEKYQIHQWTSVDEERVYIIVGHRQKADVFSQDHDMKSRDVLFLTEGADGS